MHRILWMVLGLGLLAPACTDPVAPPAPTPVTPTIRETFDGTLLQLGSNTHQFEVQQIGGLQVSLSAVSPDTTVGFAIGSQSPALGCSVIEQLEHTPGSTTQLSGTATRTGTFCVLVFDPPPGSLVEPVTYTVTVLHS